MAPPPTGCWPPASQEAGLFAVFAAGRALPSLAEPGRAQPSPAERSRTQPSPAEPYARTAAAARAPPSERASERPRPRRRRRPRGRRCPLAADRPRQRPPRSRRGGSGRRRLRGRGGGPGEGTPSLPAARRPPPAGSEPQSAPSIPRPRTLRGRAPGSTQAQDCRWTSPLPRNRCVWTGQPPRKAGATGVPLGMGLAVEGAPRSVLV
ncbi:putative hydro-lyase KRH_21160 [Equus asinus]|uniref:Hydro-lyase KRH_21160 n=1 Tax=Equus przewalskii TaxID=9798 RepID=A0ABM2FM96_EQUPR